MLAYSECRALWVLAVLVVMQISSNPALPG